MDSQIPLALIKHGQISNEQKRFPSPAAARHRFREPSFGVPRLRGAHRLKAELQTCCSPAWLLAGS
jgi:hypothetical protein